MESTSSVVILKRKNGMCISIEYGDVNHNHLFVLVQH